MAARGRCSSILNSVSTGFTVCRLTRQRCSVARLSSLSKATPLSYAYGRSDQDLVGKTQSQILDETTDAVGDDTAVISCHQNIQKTFTEFRKDVEKMAAGLLTIGLQKGDRVGMWSPNNYQWMVTQFATAKAGMVLVTVNPAYQLREVEYCLRLVKLNAIVIAEPFKTQNYYTMLQMALPQLSDSKPGQLKSSKLPDLRAVVTLEANQKPGTVTYDQVLDAAGSDHYRALYDIEKDLQFDDAVNIQFTSGTTGTPKAAVLSHHNIINNSIFIGRRLGMHTEKTTICVQVPLFHTFGCVAGSLGCVVNRATAVFPAYSFMPEPSLDAISKYRCTILYGTPTMYIDLINHPDLEKYNINTLRTGIMAGSPCPVQVIKASVEKLNMKDICVAYGSTESSPVTTMSSYLDPLEKKLDNVGRLLDHVEVKVIDPNGRTVPVNSEGEVCTRGHTTFLGYFGEKKMTDEVVDSARWYHTGDRGKLDENGFVYIVGRIKDIVIRGGENIYPREIEEFLHTHPELAEVQVFGIPCERMGEQVCAWIKVKNGASVSEDDVKAFCKGKISHFKIPQYIFFVDDFPKTASGKIQKFVMREKTVEMLCQRATANTN